MENVGNCPKKRFKILAIENCPGFEEVLSSHLFESGCLGIEVSSDRIKAYFPDGIDLRSLSGSLKSLLKMLYPFTPIEFEYQSIEDTGWEFEWRKHFEPLWIDNDLLILPPWHPRIAHTARHVIVMDPGPAFGTGKHATTRLCLSAIRKQSASFKRPWKLLDVGTGSGILAIYGAMCGAAKVLAIDLDEEALRWAKRNVDLNQLQHKITLSNKDISLVAGDFEIVVVNITFEEILKILPDLEEKVSKNGLLILSGILDREMDSMIQYLNRLEFSIKDITREEEWLCVCAVHMKNSET